MNQPKQHLQTSEYRIVTLCPHGMSPLLKDYLNRPNTADPSLLTRDVIAHEIMNHFSASRLPFAGIFFGWAVPKFAPNQLQQWLSSLDAVKSIDSTEPVSLDLFINKVEGGTIAIGGFYPFNILASDILSKELFQFGLTANPEARHRLFEWAYRTFLRGVLQSDQIGAMVVIHAKDAPLADHKIQESAALLQNYIPELESNNNP